VFFNTVGAQVFVGEAVWMKLKGLVRREASAAARAMAILAKSEAHGAKFFKDLEGMSTQMDPPLREKALLVIGEYGSMVNLEKN